MDFSTCQLQHCHTAATITVGCVSLALSMILLPFLLRKMPCSKSVLTETSAIMLLGALLSIVWITASQGHFADRVDGSGTIEEEGHQLEHVSDSALVHDLIFYVLLPPIIFEAGFGTDSRAFFANIVPISLYAGIGTVVAIITLGFFLYLCVRGGVIETPFTFNEVMLFSSLISSTDPIATLATLRTLGAAPPLYDLVFGESALNDVISIACFNAFRQLCAEERQMQIDGTPMQIDPSSQVGQLFVKLLVLLPASLLLGVAFGALAIAGTSLRTLGLREWGRPHVEVALVLLCAGLSWSVTDQIEMSPILALFFCAVTQRHFAYDKLSPRAQEGATMLFRTLAAVSEVFLSLLLGIAFIDYFYHPSSWDWTFILLSLAGMLIARALNIYPLTQLANLCRPPDKKISWRMQCVMWWAGMRGGVSFAMAMSLVDQRPAAGQQHPWGKHSHDEATITQVVSPQHAHRICTATLFAIVITNVIMAPFTTPLTRCLKVPLSSESAVIASAHETAVPSKLESSGTSNSEQDSAEAGGMRHTKETLK